QGLHRKGCGAHRHRTAAHRCPEGRCPMTAETVLLRPAAADLIETLRDRPEAERPASLSEALEPLLVSAPHAARLSGVSEATWWRLHAAAKVPRPIKLGGRTLWRVEELRRWIEAGCPDRRAWEAIQASRKGGPR